MNYSLIFFQKFLFAISLEELPQFDFDFLHFLLLFKVSKFKDPFYIHQIIYYSDKIQLILMLISLDYS